MLHELRVQNLGIVEEILVPIGPGMTVITGETGAGKTLLVDALTLLCGGRADPATVRDGADEARVEGRFTSADGTDDEIVLARVIPVVGRSRGYVNGRLATASELAELGRTLVDLHGQHAHQSLLAPAEQRALLDRAAGDAAARARGRLYDARQEALSIDAELAGLGGDERSRAREVDLLRYQLAEIDGAAITGADELEQLVAEADILGGAEDHRTALASSYETLVGAAEDSLGDAAGAIAGRAPFEALAARVRALQSETADAAREIRVALESVVVDPQRLEVVQARRALLQELTRKYGPALADVVAYRTEIATRLVELESHDARAAAAEAARAERLADARRAAAALSKARRAAAEGFAASVTEVLRTLALPNAAFSVDIRSDRSDEDPGLPSDPGAALPPEDGLDEVTFLLAPNPGEPARPLAKAASGGELSRAMLALRVVLSEAPPTLVFDEVDAGIGGEAGSAVGRALAALGGRHQVLCVTHLPQVAAFADGHVAVEKREAKGRTRAAVSLLLDDARPSELARMLAGDLDSEHAREHARELIDRAVATRTKVRRR